MSDEFDNNTTTEKATKPKAKAKPPAEGKRPRRNFEGEALVLQGRIDLALKVLRKHQSPDDLTSLAIEVLEGK